jgi:hypothetical protein
MATLDSTSLTRFTLTEEEELSGQILSLGNKQVIQNRLADCCEAKINLKFDASDINNFLQQEAELQGQIGILKLLLETSMQAEKEVVLRSQLHADQQADERNSNFGE